MTPEQVVRVLALVAVAEKIEVDQVLVSFWMNTLAVHHITEEEFRSAVVAHYASSTYPIRPGHVWQITEPKRAATRVNLSIAETAWSAEQAEAYTQAAIDNDWTQFDARYPGVRQQETERNVRWWLEHGPRWGLEIPPDVQEKARAMGEIER